MSYMSKDFSQINDSRDSTDALKSIVSTELKTFIDFEGNLFN